MLQNHNGCKTTQAFCGQIEYEILFNLQAIEARTKKNIKHQTWTKCCKWKQRLSYAYEILHPLNQTVFWSRARPIKRFRFRLLSNNWWWWSLFPCRTASKSRKTKSNSHEIFAEYVSNFHSSSSALRAHLPFDCWQLLFQKKHINTTFYNVTSKNNKKWILFRYWYFMFNNFTWSAHFSSSTTARILHRHFF